MKIALIPLDDRPCNLKFPVQLGKIAGYDVITDPRNPEAIADQVKALLVSLDRLAFGGFLASREGKTSLKEALQRLEVISEIKKKHPKLPVYLSSIILKSQVRDQKIRQRNHEINKRAVELGGFLLLGKDDIAKESLPKEEIEELKRLIAPERIFCGADELGLMLVGRCIIDKEKLNLKIALKYSTPAGPGITALYEDETISETVNKHIQALNGKVTDEKNADVILFINTPDKKQLDLFSDKPITGRKLDDFVEEIKKALEGGKKVAVADCAYANGADPDLVELLKQKIDLKKLSGFAAWNTAGNTIGTVLAQALIPVRNEKARLEFLLERFIDDYLYQTIVRRQLSSPDEAIIREKLSKVATSFLHTFRISHYALRISLPWSRLFEVDVEISL